MKPNICRYTKDFPEIISFLVTNKCVCRCRHCFNWADTNPRGAIGNSAKVDLTPEEIKRIFSSLGPLDYIYIAGGEPFIRKDLFCVLQAIYESSRPKTINISTNGQITANTCETVNNFLKQYPRVELIVKVSLDGIGEMHDVIRGLPGAFERAMTTYKSLMSLKGAYKNCKVGINTVFSSFNQDAIFDIYRYFSALDPKPDCLAQLLVRDTPRDGTTKQELNLDRYKQWTQMYVRDMVKGRFEHDFKVKVGTIVMFDYIYKILNGNRCALKCYAGISGGFIDNEGLVGPCEHLDPFGNLRENNYDFKKIWNSSGADRIRGELGNGCFCTNEPQWWHPTILHNKKIFVHSIKIFKGIISAFLRG
ncbi:MAG: radical SAM protein, partial [Candidatus Omnitrophica bacterium]|nr:radical SAM protein [Candidatus Omnitrophota bacterium]